MTPDQLKEYIDGALRQRDSFTLLYFIAFPILTFLAVFLGGYAKAKAKSIATKEDIREITHKVEDVKSAFAQNLEQLKASLVERSHFSKVRYEREMKVYEEIWPKLSALRQAVLSLRPVLDAALAPGETEESRRKVRADRYIEADLALSKAIEHARPFYPHEIWVELAALHRLCWGEALAFRHTDLRTDFEKYWKKAEENANAINAQVDQICEGIRARLTKFD